MGAASEALPGAPTSGSSTGERSVRVPLRIALIVAIGALCLFHHVQMFEQAYLHHDVSGALGFELDTAGGRAVVQQVVATSGAGGLTAAGAVDLQPGDEILEIRDQYGAGGPVRSLFGLGSIVRRIRFGEPWTIVIARPGAEGIEHAELRVPPLAAPPLGMRDRLIRFVVRVWLPGLALAAALFVGLARPADRNAVLASLMFFAFSMLFGGRLYSLPPIGREIGLALRALGGSFSTYLVMLFFLRFPTRPPVDERHPWIRYAGLVATLAILAYVAIDSVSAHVSFALRSRLFSPLGGRVPDTPLIIADLLMLGVAIFALTQNALGAASAGDRRRLGVLLAGTAASFIPLGAAIVGQLVAGETPLWLVILLAATLWLFPLTFVYAVIRHQVFGIRLIVRRGLQYALVSRGVFVLGVLLFVLTYFAARPLVLAAWPGRGESAAWVGSAALALVLAVGLRNVNRRVMPHIDRRFFRDAYDARQILSELGGAVRQLAAQPERLLQTVADQVHASLHPDRVAIFLRAGQGPAEELSCCLHTLGIGAVDDEVSLVGLAAVPAAWPLAEWLERSVGRVPDVIDLSPAGRKRLRGAPSPRPGELPEERRLLEALNASLVVPLVTSRRALGVMVLGEKLSEEPYSREDTDLLLAVAGQVAVALDYGELIGEATERERLRREIEIAKEVQEKLFPQTVPPLATLRYVGVCRPAQVVGGDYYDFLPLAPGRVGLVAADVSGKGISAALLMASLQGALRGLAPLRADDMPALVAEINSLICASAAEGKFASLFYGVYDDATRTLSYVNAGHNPPIVVRHTEDGGHETLALQPSGMVVGLFANQRYERRTVELRPGDLLVVYTDGVTEAADHEREPFGEERLAELVAAHHELDVSELCETIYAEVARFTGNAPAADDMTLIVAKVGEPASS